MLKEGLIILLFLTVLIGFIFLLYYMGILKRKVVVTIVDVLPLGLFKDTNTNLEEKILEDHDHENSNSDELNLIKLDNENSLNELQESSNSKSLELFEENNIQQIKNEEIVYWTPQGKHYHKTKNCRTLLRSKVVNSGSIEQSGKLTGCNKCN